MSDDGVVDVLSPTDPAWPEALEGLRHDVYHRPGYVALDAAGVGEPLAFRYREGGLTLMVPLVLRAVPGSDDLDATSPYGYPGPVSNAPLDAEGFWHRGCAALLQEVARRGAVTCFVRLHPLLPVRLDVLGRWGRLVQHGHTVSVDLTASEETLWGQMSRSHRKYVNRGRSRGMVVTFDDWSTLDDVALAYAETMERVGAAAMYRFTAEDFRDLRTAVGDDLHLVTVQVDGECVHGGLVLERCGIVQLHLGGTRDAALDLQANKLEVDAIRRWARERGDTVLHLGGGLGGREDSLFEFKARFSPDRTPFFTWHLVLDRAANERLVAARGPGADHGFFPVYRAPPPTS